MLLMEDVEKVYRTEHVETHALSGSTSGWTTGSSSR